MASRNKDGKHDSSDGVDIELLGNDSYNDDNQDGSDSLIGVRLVFPARVKRVGQSGKQYLWNKAGDVVLVEPMDVDGIMKAKIGLSSCCGSTSMGNRLFELA